MRIVIVSYLLLIYNQLSVCGQVTVKEFPIIPKPRSIQVVGGNYETQKIDQLIIPSKNDDAIRIGKSIQALLQLPELKIKKKAGNILPKPNSISLSLVKSAEKPDYYKLHITKNGIWIQATRAQGWFYALQTLRQLVELSDQFSIRNKMLPYCIIEDEPAFSYRGLHLDVSRHFFPVSFIKTYIELMARFKYNAFHWHLTDDQGWRIEIKKFPQLTEIGSIRKNTLIGSSSDFPPRFDSIEYRGFYTQEEIREIVQFADAHYINVIPEIEMPGHSTAALASYPEFSCSRKPVEVANQWGVFTTGIYCTRDTSLWFVKEILNEVCDLFPGKYIHIGGDECPKDNWKSCEYCQAVKRKHKLKSEEELQSYFIHQVEKFLNSKGKQLMGWDEILEGGLAPNATVMSWRGNEGGIAAAKQKHHAVMCPGSHCYFDHYQSLYPSEPLAIGGYTPLEKVYSFNPIPTELKPEERKFILGAQGNVWTEYMKDESRVLYMAYPRATALAEVNWTEPINKNYSGFLNRLMFHIPWFKNKGINITQSMLDIDYSTRSSSDGVILTFRRPPVDGKILVESMKDGDLVSEYLLQDSFILNKNVNFKAWYQLENGSLGKPLVINYKHHRAAGKTMNLKETPASKYFLSGSTSVLLNGIEAPVQKYGGPEWIGMEGKDFTAIIDLEKPDSIHHVKIQFFHSPGSWIYRPQELLLSFSMDGYNFSTPVKYQINETDTRHVQPTIPLPNAYGRYLKIEVRNHGIIEEHQPGSGHGAWLFVGEIEVESGP